MRSGIHLEHDRKGRVLDSKGMAFGIHCRLYRFHRIFNQPLDINVFFLEQKRTPSDARYVEQIVEQSNSYG